MPDYSYILFNKTPLQLRSQGARGGRTFGRNQRARRARLALMLPPPQTTPLCVAPANRCRGHRPAGRSIPLAVLRGKAALVEVRDPWRAPAEPLTHGQVKTLRRKILALCLLAARRRTRQRDRRPSAPLATRG
jgi:hypothetical protein